MGIKLRGFFVCQFFDREMSCPPNRIVEGSAFFAYNAALFAISLFVCLSFPLIFKYYKKFHRYPRLVARKTIFIYLFAIPFICFVFAEIFVEIVNYSCGLQAFLYLMIIPLILGAQICRNLRLLFLTKFYEVSRIYGKITLEEQDELIHFKYSFRDMVREIVTVFQEAGNTNQNLNPKQKVSSIFYLKKLSSPLGILGTLLIITTPTTIFALVFALARPGYTACVGCRRDLVITLIIIGEMIVGFGFALFVAFRIRHLPDPFGLITEGRLLLVFLGITVLTLPIDVAVYDGNNPNHEFMRYIFNGIYCVALWCAFFCGSILQVYLSYRSHRAENGYRSMVQSSNNAASVGGKATSQGAESESRDEYKEYADIKGCAPILCKILTNELIASDFEALLTKEYAVCCYFFLSIAAAPP